MASQPQKIQIVWDSGDECTAQTPAGRHLRVGPSGEWSPEQLLLAAAESSLMAAFVEIAGKRGLEVLGYVSSAGLTRRGDRGRVRLVVRPCIAIAAETDRDRVHALLREARERSHVARALGRSLHVAPEVVMIPQPAPSGELR